ncbi:uncharacterized protein Kmn1 [Drosophila bipectinata]|uniref:uncharacterized protein Kmn1 n=1 Tax=Drosophila bipectinata TaxID=42026 RepID=UPI001C8A067B|nr:uncharacterized protein LOC108120503 [Drosophila bipectinata]
MEFEKMDAQDKTNNISNSDPERANVSNANKSWADTSAVDFNDVTEQLERTLKGVTQDSRRRSLFNNNVVNFSEVGSKVDEVENYKKRELQKQQNFINFVLQAADNLKHLPPEDPRLEPSEEHQRYLKEGPNTENFIRGSVEFMKNANRYLREMSEALELQASISELSQCALDDLASKAIHQNLARTSKNN